MEVAISKEISIEDAVNADADSESKYLSHQLLRLERIENELLEIATETDETFSSTASKLNNAHAPGEDMNVSVAEKSPSSQIAIYCKSLLEANERKIEQLMERLKILPQSIENENTGGDQNLENKELSQTQKDQETNDLEHKQNKISQQSPELKLSCVEEIDEESGKSSEDDRSKVIEHHKNTNSENIDLIKSQFQNDYESSLVETFAKDAIDKADVSRQNSIISESYEMDLSSELPSPGGTVKKSIRNPDPISSSITMAKTRIGITPSTPPAKTHNLKEINEHFFINSPSSALSIDPSLLVTPDLNRYQRNTLIHSDQGSIINEDMKQYPEKDQSPRRNDMEQNIRIKNTILDQTINQVKGVHNKNKQRIDRTIPHNPLSNRRTAGRYSIPFNSSNMQYSQIRKSLPNPVNKRISASGDPCLNQRISSFFGPKSPLHRLPLASAWISRHTDRSRITHSMNKPTRKATEPKSLNGNASLAYGKSDFVNRTHWDDLKFIRRHEYLSAPYAIQENVFLEEANDALKCFYAWKEEIAKYSRENIIIFTKIEAFEILGNHIIQEKKQNVLMSLCFWKKIVMKIVDGEKKFKLNF